MSALMIVLAIVLAGCGARLPDDPEQARAEATAALERSLAALDAGNWREGERDARRALQLLEHVDADDLSRAEARVHLAWAALGRGDLDAAAQQESTIARVCASVAPGTNGLRTYVQHLMGTVHHRQQRPEGARRWWEPTLADLRADAEPDAGSIVWVGSDLAEQLRRLGEFARAESLQVEMVRLARAQVGAGQLLAIVVNNLGAMYWDQERLAEAEALYLEALALSLADSSASAERRAKAYLNLGVLRHEQGRWDAATDPLDRALELGAEVFGADDPERVWFLLERGRLAASQRQWRRAIEWWEEGVAILERAPQSRPLYEAFLRQALARARMEDGRADLAVEHFSRSLQLREQVLGARHADVGEVLAELAEAQWEQGDVAAAGRSAARAHEFLAGSSVHSEQRALAAVVRARVSLGAGDTTSALAQYDRALETIEELRPRRGGGEGSRVRFLGRHVDWALERVDLAVATGDLEAAVLGVERVRARALRDRMLGSGPSFVHALPDSIAEQLDRARRAALGRIAAAQRELAVVRQSPAEADAVLAESVARWESERDEAMLALEDVEARVEAQRARLGLGSVTTSPSIGDLDLLLERAVQRDELVLLYAVGARGSRVFAITPGPRTILSAPLVVDDERGAALGLTAGPLRARDLHVVLQALRKRRDEPSRGVTGLVTARDAAAPADAARLPHALFEVLVPAAIRDAVMEASAVVVLPDADLHRLPFEMLEVRARGDGDARTYWLDEGPVVRYGQSLATLAAARARPNDATRDRVVIVCDPEFAGAGFPSARSMPALAALPGTRSEAEAIARVVGADGAAVFSGERATERAVTEWAPRARVLHLATHGHVDEQEGGRWAALAFAQPSGSSAENAASSGATDGEIDAADDGFLHLFEVYDLPLDGCELVVLSACETQLGRGVRGEGVFALSRGFLAAGARRTIASLWSVNDASTARLMTVFFEQWSRPDDTFDAARALRDAKRALRADPRWSDPHYWAAFVASGAR